MDIVGSELKRRELRGQRIVEGLTGFPTSRFSAIVFSVLPAQTTLVFAFYLLRTTKYDENRLSWI